MLIYLIETSLIHLLQKKIHTQVDVIVIENNKYIYLQIDKISNWSKLTVV